MLDASGEKMNLTIFWFFETLATEKSATELAKNLLSESRLLDLHLANLVLSESVSRVLDGFEFAQTVVDQLCRESMGGRKGGRRGMEDFEAVCSSLRPANLFNASMFVRFPL